MVRNVPVNERHGKRQARLNMYEVSSPPTIESRTAGVFLKSPAIHHKEAGKDVFIGRSMGLKR